MQKIVKNRPIKLRDNKYSDNRTVADFIRRQM